MLDKNEAICKLYRAAFKFRSSMTISSRLVRWHDETCADDADDSGAATNKNRRDKGTEIKHFFQP